MAPPQPAHAHAFDPTGRAALDPRYHHGTEKHQIAEAHSHSSSVFLILLRKRITLPIRVLHMSIHDPDELPPLQSSPLQRCSGRRKFPCLDQIFELGAGQPMSLPLCDTFPLTGSEASWSTSYLNIMRVNIMIGTHVATAKTLA